LPVKKELYVSSFCDLSVKDFKNITADKTLDFIFCSLDSSNKRNIFLKILAQRLNPLLSYLENIVPN